MLTPEHPEALSPVLDLKATAGIGDSIAAYPDALAGLLDLSEGMAHNAQKTSILKGAISEITELREMKADKYPVALSGVLDLKAKAGMGDSATAYPDALAGLLDLSEGRTDDVQQADPRSKSADDKGSRSLPDTTSAKKWTPPAGYTPSRKDNAQKASPSGCVPGGTQAVSRPVDAASRSSAPSTRARVKDVPVRATGMPL
jgi:hypothetical protein